MGEDGRTGVNFSEMPNPPPRRAPGWSRLALFAALSCGTSAARCRGGVVRRRSEGSAQGSIIRHLLSTQVTGPGCGQALMQPLPIRSRSASSCRIRARTSSPRSYLTAT